MSENKKHTSFSMTIKEYNKIRDFRSGTQTISQFCYSAMQEKIKRMEVRDKSARMQLHKKDVDMFEPIIIEILKRYGLV